MQPQRGGGQRPSATATSSCSPATSRPPSGSCGAATTCSSRSASTAIARASRPIIAGPLYCQGRYDEAERFAAIVGGDGLGGDIWSQILFRATRAKVLAQEGRYDEAAALGAAALEIVERTDLARSPRRRAARPRRGAAPRRPPGRAAAADRGGARAVRAEGKRRLGGAGADADRARRSRSPRRRAAGAISGSSGRGSSGGT